MSELVASELAVITFGELAAGDLFEFYSPPLLLPGGQFAPEEGIEVYVKESARKYRLHVEEVDPYGRTDVQGRSRETTPRRRVVRRSGQPQPPVESSLVLRMRHSGEVSAGSEVPF